MTTILGIQTGDNVDDLVINPAISCGNSPPDPRLHFQQ